jgi:hypothetical protein
MKTVFDFVFALGNHLMNVSFVFTFCLLLIHLFFKKTDLTTAKNRVRWFLIIYSVAVTLNLVYFLMTHNQDDVIFIKRITGPYKFSYLLMLLANTILPLFLFIRKIGTNIYCIVLLTLLMNLGWIMEYIIMNMLIK